MTLSLTPDFRLTDDGTNLTLQRLSSHSKGKNAGTPCWLDCGYFSTLLSALTFAADAIPRDAHPPNLAAAVATLITTQNLLCNALDAQKPAVREILRAKAARVAAGT